MALVVYTLCLLVVASLFYSIREAVRMRVGYRDFWRHWWAEIKFGANTKLKD